MILYRKGAALRVRRAPAPEPPFWCATTLAPYSSRRATPVALDYLELRMTATEKLEVTVADDLVVQMQRAAPKISQPVLIETSEAAEEVFRCGDLLAAQCSGLGYESIRLISSRGVLPGTDGRSTSVIVSAWPLDLPRISALAEEAAARGHAWGMLIPVIYPLTTDLGALEKLAELAVVHRAMFFAAAAVEVEASARRAIMQTLATTADDDTYAMLFHSDLEPLQVATERHVAALAAERGLFDFIPPPGWPERSNWNCATLLTMTAARMIAMEHEVGLAGLLARSARIVASLDKPLTRIASAASLSIIDALDDASIDILTEWLERASAHFVDAVNGRWRLRRDHGV